jgi:hypothetical protein
MITITVRMMSINTEMSNPLEEFHIKSLHVSSSIADCIYCTVYCQLKYSTKMLKHLLPILELYITVGVIYTFPVHHLQV